MVAKLVRALVQMDDAHASFQIPRLTAVSRLPNLLPTFPPPITHEVFDVYDAQVE